MKQKLIKISKNPVQQDFLNQIQELFEGCDDLYDYANLVAALTKATKAARDEFNHVATNTYNLKGNQDLWIHHAMMDWTKWNSKEDKPKSNVTDLDNRQLKFLSGITEILGSNAHRVNIPFLITNYGIQRTRRLLMDLQYSKDNDIRPVYGISKEDYLKAGISTREWYEDFVDEDNGEVITIDMYNLVPFHSTLNPIKNG